MFEELQLSLRTMTLRPSVCVFYEDFFWVWVKFCSGQVQTIEPGREYVHPAAWVCLWNTESAKRFECSQHPVVPLQFTSEQTDSNRNCRRLDMTSFPRIQTHIGRKRCTKVRATKLFNLLVNIIQPKQYFLLLSTWLYFSTGSPSLECHHY